MERAAIYHPNAKIMDVKHKFSFASCVTRGAFGAVEGRLILLSISMGPRHEPVRVLLRRGHNSEPAL